MKILQFFRSTDTHCSSNIFFTFGAKVIQTLLKGISEKEHNDMEFQILKYA